MIPSLISPPPHPPIPSQHTQPGKPSRTFSGKEGFSRPNTHSTQTAARVDNIQRPIIPIVHLSRQPSVIQTQRIHAPNAPITPSTPPIPCFLQGISERDLRRVTWIGDSPNGICIQCGRLSPGQQDRLLQYTAQSTPHPPPPSTTQTKHEIKPPIEQDQNRLQDPSTDRPSSNSSFRFTPLPSLVANSTYGIGPFSELLVKNS